MTELKTPGPQYFRLIARRQMVLAVPAAVTLLGLSRIARAHHGWSSFDTDKPLYVEGTVKSVRWQNPHAELVIDLKPGLSTPTVLIKRILPAQTQPVDGKSLLAKAKVPNSDAKTWTLELAPLTRVEAWKVAQPAPGSIIAALGYALPGEKSAVMRVEYLMVGDATYGLRSMPAS
jgi:Family of unknown function (DUF6152)